MIKASQVLEQFIAVEENDEFDIMEDLGLLLSEDLFDSPEEYQAYKADLLEAKRIFGRLKKTAKKAKNKASQIKRATPQKKRFSGKKGLAVAGAAGAYFGGAKMHRKLQKKRANKDF